MLGPGGGGIADGCEGEFEPELELGSLEDFNFAVDDGMGK